MELRPIKISLSAPGSSLGRSRLAALAALLALLAVGALAGETRAGLADYPSPLYLSGAPSGSINTPGAVSHKLIGTAGPGIPATPTATAIVGGTMTAGSYTYVVTVVDPVGGESAPSAVSNTASVASFVCSTCKQVRVGNLPTSGQTIRIYRKRGGRFHFLVELPNNTSATYTDSIAPDPPSAAILPVSENRVATGVTGFAEFAPGIPATAVTTDNSAVTTLTPGAAVPSGRGWVVDGTGNVAFAAGEWAFAIRTKGYAHPNGVAELRAGMWKVKTANGAITSATMILDPATAADEAAPTENLISGSAAQTVTYRVTLPAFQLAADEHLYIQLWRNQTSAYTTSGSSEGRLVSLYVYDGTGRVTRPAASTLPNVPTLTNPADGLSTTTSPPGVYARFSDPDAGDTGTLDFRLCPDANCASVLRSWTAPGPLSSGSTAWWELNPAVTPGTYYWQVRAQDALGGTSDWSATRSFRVHRRPAVPALVSPAGGGEVRDSSPRLAAKFSDPDGDAGRVAFRLCKKATVAGVACADPVAAGRSVLVTSGTTAAWAAGSGLPDGTYYWQTRGRDIDNAVSTWTATRKVTIANRLIRIVSARRLTCVVGATLAPYVKLAAGADVTAYLTTRSRLDDVKSFGRVPAGTSVLKLRLSWALERPAVYWIRWKATRKSETDAAWMRVELTRYRGGTPTCKPDTA